MQELHLNDIFSENVIYIYGDGNNTEALIPILNTYFSKVKIESILVTNSEESCRYKFNVPVVAVKDVPSNRKNTMVLISTKDKYVPEIINTLSVFKFKRYITLSFESSDLERLRIIALRDIFEKEGKKFITTDDILPDVVETDSNLSLSVSMVKCHLDKKINNAMPHEYTDYLLPLQVGAALTDIRIADRTDDIGDNISCLNQKYCELTGTYWIWKNDNSDIKGLCHYRRIFKLTRAQIQWLFDQGINVILPVPILCRPNVRSIYERDHFLRDWKCMLECIKRCKPMYYQAALEMEQSEYYYGYNMVIAKRNEFNAYCEFLFPLLKMIDKIENSNKKYEYCETYQRRYIGFLVERLTSLYFTYHKEYRVVSARKIFIN